VDDLMTDHATPNELERRGYLQAGGLVPVVVLERPEKVAELHREFVHAGSDVVEAVREAVRENRDYPTEH
jgi:methionine synthase I (cobalamin-dependent)